MSLRECVRCDSDTKKHERCSRRTCKLPAQCFQHLNSSQALAVRPSTIAGGGQGLFTTKGLKKDTKVASYKGDVLTRPQLHARYANGHGDYAIQMGQNRFIDARSTQSSVARYANSCDKPGAKRPCNCKLTQGGAHAALKTTKAVAAGSELFTPYGKAYWQLQLHGN
jgi:hypothetical protein